MTDKIKDLSQAARETATGIADATRKQIGLPASDTLEYKAGKTADSGKKFAKDAEDLVITAGKKAGDYIQQEAPEAVDHVLRNKEAYGAAALGGLGYLAYKKWKRNRGIY